MPVYNRPDVYVEEISTLPPSVAEVSTAIPAFIGYTEYDSLTLQPTRITSFLEFTTLFGGAAPVPFTADTTGELPLINIDAQDTMRDHKLYYALDLYFKNGGSDCYIVSLGAFKTKAKSDFEKGIAALITEDEPTLIILSEATTLTDSNEYYSLCQQALTQCAGMQDRFCILDVLPPADNTTTATDAAILQFRGGIGNQNMSYGAAYFPYLYTTLNYVYNEDNVTIAATGTAPKAVAGGITVTSKKAVSNTDKPRVTIAVPTGDGAASDISFAAAANGLTITAPPNKTAQNVYDAWNSNQKITQLKADFDMAATNGAAKVVAATANFTATTSPSASLTSIKQTQPTLYNAIKQEMGKFKLVLPPAAAIAGVYALTDRTRGVWKAPANVSLNAVIGPTIKISNQAQDRLNVDATTGKSINAIRSFTGKGTLVWGARTLDGSSNEWRYVPVRRLFIMIEESAKKASYFAVFEPNDASTWLKVKGTIESFLYSLWQQGALAGSTPKAAYYVNIGLGITMTQQDILEGRMIVEIGIAAVRPAEFLILRFSHKLQEA